MTIDDYFSAMERSLLGNPQVAQIEEPMTCLAKAASDLFNRVLPDLGLYLHKIGHQYGIGYEQALQPALADKERGLAKVLAAGSPRSGDVDGLDQRLKALAAAYDDFAADLAVFQRLAQAVRVNLSNLRQCFGEHNLPREGPLAARLTAAERAEEQLQADDGFYQARVHQAEMALAALQVQADIDRNRIEKEEARQAERRNLLLGFVGMVLALGQIMGDDLVEVFVRWFLGLFGREPVDPFPVVHTFWVKLVLVLGAGLIGIGLAWGFGRLWTRLRGRG